MSKVTGKGPIYIDSSPVLEMGNWSLNMSNAVETFNDLITNAQSADYGVQAFSGSASGISALEDTTGQDLIESAALNKTKISNIKFYEKYTDVSGEKTVYWAPKSGSNGIVVSAKNIVKDGGSETTKIDFSFTNDGLMEKVVETVV